MNNVAADNIESIQKILASDMIFKDQLNMIVYTLRNERVEDLFVLIKNKTNEWTGLDEGMIRFQVAELIINGSINLDKKV